MSRKRTNEKAARARSINQFEHEDDPSTAGRYDRNAEKAKAETGLDPILGSEMTADDKTALDAAWPIPHQTAEEVARARARSSQPGS